MNLHFKYGLQNDVIEKICAVFKNHSEVKRVILYGSRAMGNNRVNSDIDLCMEGEQLNLTLLLKIENELDDLLLPWKIDLSLKHNIDNPALLEHINKKGIVFFPK